MTLTMEGEHGEERRHKPRALVSVPLLVSGRDRRPLMRGRTIDLSSSGALVHGAGPIRVGQRVLVEIPRGDSRNPLILEAEVVRITSPTHHRMQHGVALRFVEVSGLDEAILETIIAAARR